MSAAGKHSQPYPWEQRKPKNYLRESRILGSTGVDAKKLTVKLWGKGVVEKKESISGSSNTRYYIRHAGQLMYGKLDFLHAAFGIVPKELDKYESTADSPAFDIIDGNPKFLLESFLRKEFYLRNGQRANGSRKAKRIHEKDFLEMPILVPYKSEQTKIGNLINSLDKTITLHEEQHRQLEQLKKALLQKMFANETGYPALRFKGFTEKWEQHKLGEITDVRDGTHDSPHYVDEGYPLITSKNVSNGRINYDAVNYVSEYDFNQINKRSKVNINDILMGMIGTIGNLALIREDPNFAIKNVALIKYTESINHQFLFQNLQTSYISKELSNSMDGGTQKFISLKKIRNLSIKFPILNEQFEIGQLFQSLDRTITLHDKKIQYLKQLKRGLLQKMFV